MPARRKGIVCSHGQAETLANKELDFLNVVSMGNLAHTKAALETDPERARHLLQVTDCKDRTALEIATENEHYDIVFYIVHEHADYLEFHHINESLMLAITKGYFSITKVLLEHHSSKQMGDRARNVLGRPEAFYDRNFHSKFDRDITPIMMAATCNTVDILRLFLEKGETIEKPHHPLCHCTSCLNRKEFDPLMHSLATINAYRALCSEAYISLTSPDPILTAFLLSDELQDLALTEKEFKNEYKELQDRCKNYASDLIDMCQNTDAVKTILKQKAVAEREIKPLMREHAGGSSTGGAGDEEGEHYLPRLELAIKLKQKQFVAHPHCQHHLSILWYQGFPGLRQIRKWQRALIIPLLVSLLPFAVILYLLYPKGKFGAFMRSPIVKFLTQSTMYVIFLLLMFLESVAAETFRRDEPSVGEFLEKNVGCTKLQEELASNSSKTSLLRSDNLSFVEYTLIVFVAGMAWQGIKQIWREGFVTYFTSFWNWIDVTMLNLLIAALVIMVSQSLITHSARLYFSTNYTVTACEALTTRNATALHYVYFLDGDRKVWTNDDPTLVAEGLFAMANVLSFSRLSFILPVSEFLGPLQISLGRMMSDIARFAAVFGVVFLAFFCAMCNLYWYYPSDSSFGTLNNSFKTLMWAIFGLGDPSDTQCPSGAPGCGHELTESFGVVLYATYHLVMVVVMLNMLIAMMSTSFEAINNDEDAEWKFSRSKLLMAYFEKGATLPSPFNLIPSPKSVFYAARWLRNKLWRNSNTRLKQRRNNSDKAQPQLRQAVRRPRTNHESLMKNVVKRYLFQLQRTKETDEVDEGESDEIKNDISSFRFDVLEILKSLETRLLPSSAAQRSGGARDHTTAPSVRAGGKTQSGTGADPTAGDLEEGRSRKLQPDGAQSTGTDLDATDRMEKKLERLSSEFELLRADILNGFRPSK